MSNQESSTTTDVRTSIRDRFMDNDAPVMFSFTAKSGEAEHTLARHVSWPDRSIGYDIETPDASSVVNALDVLQTMREQQFAGMAAPHISAGMDGEIVFEWWGHNRKLTMYVAGSKSECIRVWGPDVDGDMDDSLLSSKGDIRQALAWIA